jgi:hypothetical protein
LARGIKAESVKHGGYKTRATCNVIYIKTLCGIARHINEQKLKPVGFWVATSSSIVNDYELFRGTYGFHPQGRSAPPPPHQPQYRVS